MSKKDEEEESVSLNFLYRIIYLLLIVSSCTTSNTPTIEAPTPTLSAYNYLARGGSQFIAGDFEQAILSFTHAIELDGKLADAYNQRGRAYAAQGNYEMVIADLTRAIELGLGSSENYYFRGIIYADLKDYELAISDLTRAIELQSTNAEIYYIRGLAYRDIEDFQLAIIDFTRAIELQYDYTEAYFARGFTYLGLRQYNQAISDYTRVIELIPDSADSYYNRGLAYRMLGEMGKAQTDLQEYEGLTGKKVDPFTFELVDAVTQPATASEETPSVLPQSETKNEVKQIVESFFDTWSQGDYEVMYSYLSTIIKQSVFIEGMTKAIAPVRDFNITLIELIDDQHAKVSFSVEMPDAEWIISEVLFDEFGYPPKCHELNEVALAFVPKEDFVNLVRQNGKWKIGFRGNADFLREGNVVLQFLFDDFFLTRILAEPEKNELDELILSSTLAEYTTVFKVADSEIPDLAAGVLAHFVAISHLCRD